MILNIKLHLNITFDPSELLLITADKLKYKF